jgi:hypothetical protein
LASRTPAREKLDPETAARRFFDAFLAQDRAGMERVLLTYDELVSLVKQPPPREEFEQLTQRFLDDRLREAGEAPPGTSLQGVQLEKQETLPSSEKLKRDLNVASVRPVLHRNGEAGPGMAFLFVDTGSGYKLSIKH